MKRTYFVVFSLFLSIFLLSGCADNRFASEKLFWQAEQEGVKIVKAKSQEELISKDYDEIISAYRKVVDRFPLERLAAKAQFVIANIYIKQKQYDKAQAELRAVIENFSSSAQIAGTAQFAIGEIFELQGKSKQALDEYEKVTDLYPLSPLGLSTPLYITQYYKKIDDKSGQTKAHRQAVRHYKKIIGDYADTSVAGRVQNYLAQAYLQREDWDGAIKVWDEIIIKHPNTPQAIRGLLAKAEIRAKELKDLAGAIEIYQECIEKYPQAGFLKEIKLRLGSLYLENSQIDKAKEIFSSLIKNYSKDESLTVRSQLGHISCLKKEGLTNEVIKSYENLKEAHPNSPTAFGTPYLIFRYYRQINDSKNAAIALDKAISEYKEEFSPASHDKENFILARLLFLCYTEKKDWKEALNLLQGLSDNNQKDPGYLLSMAIIYVKELGDKSRAKEIYEEIIDKYSANKSLVKLVNEQIVSLDKPATRERTQE